MYKNLPWTTAKKKKVPTENLSCSSTKNKILIGNCHAELQKNTYMAKNNAIVNLKKNKPT